MNSPKKAWKYQQEAVMPKESLSRKLGRFASSLDFGSLPDDVIVRAKACVLDALSSMIAGYELPWSQIARGVICKSVGKSTIVGSTRKFAAADAAFANAVLVHSLAYEDHWHTPGGGHQGVAVIPTVLAVAEEKSSSGQDAICAIVAGYELYGRIYLGLNGLRKGFRTVPVIGTFGAATAAGKLMGLDEDKMAVAMEYAANFACGVNECWSSGTMEAMFHAGIAARNGIMAATLAAAGASASAATLEGPRGFYSAFSQDEWDPSPITADLGKNFLILDVLQKLYPACANSQMSMDIARSLRKKYEIDSSHISKVLVVVSTQIKSMAGQDFSGPFSSQFQAQLSSQFSVAAALLGKQIDDPIFYIEHHDDPDVAKLAKRIELIGEAGRAFPRIEVYMKNGRKFVLEEDRRSKLILSLDTAQRKFRRLASKSLDKTTVNKVIASVNNLEQMQNIQELTKNLMRLQKRSMR